MHPQSIIVPVSNSLTDIIMNPLYFLLHIHAHSLLIQLCNSTLNTTGWKTSDMLDGIEGIMNLAAASGEDLATTSDIVTDALTAFGLTAKDSGHFADILAAASSNANTKAMDD